MTNGVYQNERLMKEKAGDGGVIDPLDRRLSFSIAVMYVLYI